MFIPIVQFSVSSRLLDYSKIIVEIYEKDESFAHILVFFIDSVLHI
jgi:hypothetical protein